MYDWCFSDGKNTDFFANFKMFCQKTSLIVEKEVSLHAKELRMRMKTKHVQYQTHGTCSQLIDVTADENNVIQQVFFLGGCNGNLQGISQLVKGQHIDDVISRLNGIRCGSKGTSCPDQLCRALEQLKEVKF